MVWPILPLSGHKLTDQLEILIDTRSAAASSSVIVDHLLKLESASLVAPTPAKHYSKCTDSDDSDETRPGSLLSTPRNDISSPFYRSSGRRISSDTSPSSDGSFTMFADELAKFCHIFEHHEPRIVELVQADTRESVITWIGKVIVAMHWPLGAFFTAVHAFDFSLTEQTALSNGGLATCHPALWDRGADTCIPLLSTACVLVGVSSECDHKQLAKARCFVGQVPNVKSVREIICKQLSIVAYLSRGTLVNKTPLDFVLLFLASLRRTRPDCFAYLRNNGLRLECEQRDSLLLHVCRDSEPTSSVWSLLCLTTELILGVAVVGTVSQAYCSFPLSKLIAAILFDTLHHLRPIPQNEMATFCTSIFGIEYSNGIEPLLPYLPRIYRSCQQAARSKGQDDSVKLLEWPSRASVLLDLLLSH